MVDSQIYNRGSSWRKWDLHVHTPFSLVEDYGGNTDDAWEDFITDLEALPPEFSVIGINDYLFIDGYEKVLKYKEDGRLANIDTIFPVIEFRIKKFGGHQEFKRINFHVILSDKLTPQIIQQQFLNQLYGKYKLAPGHEGIQWNGVVTPESLADLGAAIKATVPSEKIRDYGSDVHEGFNNINFEENEILNLLISSSYLKDHFVSAIGKTEWDSFNWNDSSIAEKKTIINSVDFVFTASKNVSAYINAKNKLTEQQVNDLLFDCSDAHELSTGASKDRIGNCYTWIKSDPTFEGLRQVIFEPEERIKVQERKPGSSKSERVLIDQVQFNNETGENQVIYLNRDLNSIIGVRGSGKSTLLKNIAHKVDPTQYTERDKKLPYQLGDFKVIWMDGEENAGTEDSPKNIFYVPQNYLSSLTYDDGDRIKERDAFLRKLLTKNVQFENAIQTYEQFASQNKLKIESLIEKLLAADNTIKGSKALLRKQGSKVEIEKEIDAKNVEIKQFQEESGNEVTEEEIDNYSKTQGELNDSKKKLEILLQDYQILNTLHESGVDIFVSDQQFSMLSISRQDTMKNQLDKENKKNLDALIKEELVKIVAQEGTLRISVAAKEKTLLKIGKKIKQSQALEDLAKELGVLRDTKVRIESLISKIDSSKVEEEASVEALLNAYSEFDSQQEVIFGTVDFDQAFSFLDVKVVAQYGLLQIKHFVEHYINTRDTDSKLKAEEDIRDLFGESPNKPTEDTIRKLIHSLLDGSLEIKVEAESVSNVLSQLLKNRYEIDYLNSVKTKDGTTCFKDMTGGQKAIALLELIFRFDDENYPILIDQPEDDLDVGGIATDLVNFIQNEKKDRQIIVVSHNASLVICADSEEIIVSSINHVGDGKHDFSYATGSIENPKRKEDVITVLEGGSGALRKRMSKLNIR